MVTDPECRLLRPVKPRPNNRREAPACPLNQDEGLTSENPRTSLAATRFKRIIRKAGKAVGKAVQKAIVDVVSETAKKIILGS